MPSDDIEISDNPEARRFEARLGAELEGILEYRLAGSRRILIHTEVSPAFEGRGVGGALARHALEAARTAGTRVSNKCPFVRSWLERHPEYDDVVITMPRTSPGR